MIITIAFGIILAVLLLPIVGWLIGFLLGLTLETLGRIAEIPVAISKTPFSWRRFVLVEVPKAIAVFFVIVMGVYGLITSTWYVASLVTPEETPQMTATFLGTFGFIITGLILWGKRQIKKDKQGSHESAKGETK